MALDPRVGAAAPKILATGGLATLIAGDSRFVETIDDMLTLDGLRIIFDRNRDRNLVRNLDRNLDRSRSDSKTGKPSAARPIRRKSPVS
jgi:type III pantothenate kinase